MTKRSDTASFLPLHPFEFRILMALNDGPSYGTEIVRQVEARETGASKLYPANLFRRIRDLLKRGLLIECDAPAGADSRRTYVLMTRTGRDVVRAEAERLAELVRDARALDLVRGN